MQYKVAQMFNLQKSTIKRKGEVIGILYVYRNYRGTRKGLIDITKQVREKTIKGCEREFAKSQVLKLYPEAEFWR